MIEDERDRVLQRIDETLLRLLAVNSMALGIMTVHTGVLDQTMRDTANELIVSTGKYLTENFKPTGG